MTEKSGAFFTDGKALRFFFEEIFDAQIPKTREEAEALEGMIAQRRDFHAHPEEGWCEFRTTAAIVRVLENLGFAVLTGEDVIAPDARMGVVEERRRSKKEPMRRSSTA